jgi:hypothetical protein
MSYSRKGGIGAKTMMNMSSLPEIGNNGGGVASIIKEMQRVKERLHRYF